MNKLFRRPRGYITKKEFADLLGVEVKTIDRRLKTEPMLAKVKLRSGQRVWIPEERANAYFEYSKRRGNT